MHTEMDELLKFKEIWQIVQDQEIRIRPLKNRILIRKQSNRIVAKFRKSLLIEVCLCMIVLPIIAWAFITNMASINRNFLFFLGVLVISCAGYYLHKYRELGKMEPAAGFNVKQFLNEQLLWMQEFVRVYMRLNLSLLAFCILILMILGIDSPLYLLQEITGFNQYAISLAILVITAMITLAAYPLLKLYIYGMFGRYIGQLESNIRELEENES